MEKQATTRISTSKLPDGQYTHTRRESLKDLIRVHFPEYRLNDDSNDGHGQLNLDICRSRTNMGDWNLARNVINQSKSDGF
jgi:hypothetical protein